MMKIVTNAKEADALEFGDQFIIEPQGVKDDPNSETAPQDLLTSGWDEKVRELRERIEDRFKKNDEQISSGDGKSDPKPNPGKGKKKEG